MELEIVEPYAFHSAKVITELLLPLPTSLQWHTDGTGLLQEFFH